MKNKIVIFDFDGTIADSFYEVVETFNRLAREYNLCEVKTEDIPKLRKMTSYEIIKKFKFPKWRLPFLLKKGKTIFSDRISSIKIFDGMDEVLAKLKSEGCVLGILSSNSEKNIREFLNRNGIDVFDFIFTENSLFGKDKIIKKIIKKYNFDPQEIVYIGDETRDVEAAKKCGLISVAVTWGFNDREVLEKLKPDYLVDKPEELLSILVYEQIT